MSRIEKLIERLLSKPSDFTWTELKKVLGHYGFDELKGGKTGGSRRRFVNKEKHIITLHKPHPKEILKRYQLTEVINVLKDKRLL